MRDFSDFERVVTYDPLFFIKIISIRKVHQYQRPASNQLGYSRRGSESNRWGRAAARYHEFFGCAQACGGERNGFSQDLAYGKSARMQDHGLRQIQVRTRQKRKGIAKKSEDG